MAEQSKAVNMKKQIKAYDSEMQTFCKGFPMFVPLVENGYFDTEVTRIIVAEYLEEIEIKVLIHLFWAVRIIL